MPIATAITMPVRRAAGVLALTLALAGCGGSNAESDAPTPAPDASNAAPDSASGHAVQQALTQLPAIDADDYPVAISIADLDAATEQSSLQRPASYDDKDALKAWAWPLSSAGDDVEPAPVHVPFAELLQANSVLDPTEPSFHDELGWSVVDAETFVESRAGLTKFLVISGDFDDSTFPEGIPEVADGVVTAGEGDDYAADPLNSTVARPLGAPLRMAIDGSYLAAGNSTDNVTAWLDGPAETLADDPDLAAVAATLDNAGVVSAYLQAGEFRSLADQVLMGGLIEGQTPEEATAAQEALQETVPVGPYTAVGIGWSAPEGETVITVVFTFATEGTASAAADSYEQMFAETSTIEDGQPLSDLYTFEDATSEGPVAVLTLGVGDSGKPSTAHAALMKSDLPFLYQ